ncbi:hypothetical protein llap_13750 [Limosa lapponica baueri]|uniref:Uncharacterized protein n=1 Tax=Limosa lapponica baueri TaxID=1758121 RepID=A0A2I0TQ75_LIMLA|nr:hypothetical protein llap_13750 [Limosa lapponica baueri]
MVTPASSSSAALTSPQLLYAPQVQLSPGDLHQLKDSGLMPNWIEDYTPLQPTKQFFRQQPTVIVHCQSSRKMLLLSALSLLPVMGSRIHTPIAS